MTFLERLLKTIRGKMNDITDDMATGGCADFADYKFRTGLIQGLAIAERDILDQIEAQELED